MATKADYGDTWQELQVKFDLDSCSWKIQMSLFQEDLPESSVTLPELGMTCAGSIHAANPLAYRKQDGVHMLWPTPNAGNHKWGGTLQELGGSRNKLRNTWLGRQKLSPQWWEWLMDWPQGWTDLKPLATDKLQLWRQQHSGFCHKD